MNAKHLFIFGASVLTLCLCGPARAEEAQGPYVRLAELEIDPAQLESFQSAVKEGIETAVRVEPGVLALYAVAEKDNPSRVVVFEIYTDCSRPKTRHPGLAPPSRLSPAPALPGIPIRSVRP